MDVGAPRVSVLFRCALFLSFVCHADNVVEFFYLFGLEITDGKGKMGWVCSYTAGNFASYFLHFNDLQEH